MADMDWVRKTHAGYIDGMNEHARELEERGERHLYGAAINRINLLMEHSAELEAKLQEAESQTGYWALKAKVERLEKVIQGALLCDTVVQMSECLQAALEGEQDG